MTNLEPLAKPASKAPKAPKAKRAKAPAEFRALEHVSTHLIDPAREPWVTEKGARLYCTSTNSSWALQVRGQVRTKTGPGKHFGIGTASMTREDLLWLRDLIDASLGQP